MTALKTTQLAAAFEPAGADDWRALVDKALKGADYDKVLTSRTRDGFVVEPLYSQTTEASTRPARATAGPWDVVQRVDHPVAEQAAQQALADLQGGASGLVLVDDHGIGARGFGNTDIGAPALGERMDGVVLNIVRLRLDAGINALELAVSLAALIRKQGYEPETVILDPAFDPVAAFAARNAPVPSPSKSGKLVKHLLGLGLGGTIITGDGRCVNDAGGTPAQELGYVLAALVEAMRAGEDEGQNIEALSARACAVLSADADIFLSMAKMRAMRLLWARVLDASELPQAPLRLEAETAWRMQSRSDASVNMLRATAAVSAAGLGGADGITVLPHTLAIGLPDRFARRVARNIQNVLIEESNLHRVADPAGGSGYIETVTTELARSAWGIFQKIEAEGGASAAIVSGMLPEMIGEARVALEKDVARRKVPLTGVSEFPKIGEKTPAVLEPAPGGTVDASPLTPIRLSAPFEILRSRADDAFERPTAYLACLGSLPEFTPRAQFAENLLAAGGIAVQTGDGGEDVASIAAAAEGHALAIICGTDEAYAEHLTALTTALRDAGTSQVWLAGRSDTDAVERMIHAGCDTVEALSAALGVLEARRGGDEGS